MIIIIYARRVLCRLMNKILSQTTLSLVVGWSGSLKVVVGNCRFVVGKQEDRTLVQKAVIHYSGYHALGQPHFTGLCFKLVATF